MECLRCGSESGDRGLAQHVTRAADRRAARAEADRVSIRSEVPLETQYPPAKSPILSTEQVDDVVRAALWIADSARCGGNTLYAQERLRALLMSFGAERAQSVGLT